MRDGPGLGHGMIFLTNCAGSDACECVRKLQRVLGPAVGAMLGLHLVVHEVTLRMSHALEALRVYARVAFLFIYISPWYVMRPLHVVEWGMVWRASPTPMRHEGSVQLNLARTLAYSAMTGTMTEGGNIGHVGPYRFSKYRASRPLNKRPRLVRAGAVATGGDRNVTISTKLIKAPSR
jgi:hypothetical protein